jgi:hypothetical protein
MGRRPVAFQRVGDLAGDVAEERPAAGEVEGVAAVEEIEVDAVLDDVADGVVDVRTDQLDLHEAGRASLPSKHEVGQRGEVVAVAPAGGEELVGRLDGGTEEEVEMLEEVGELLGRQAGRLEVPQGEGGVGPRRLRRHGGREERRREERRGRAPRAPAPGTGRRGGMGPSGGRAHGLRIQFDPRVAVSSNQAIGGAESVRVMPLHRRVGPGP